MGTTGQLIARAMVAGERDGAALAEFRDRRCKADVATIAGQPARQLARRAPVRPGTGAGAPRRAAGTDRGVRGPHRRRVGATCRRHPADPPVPRTRPTRTTARDARRRPDGHTHRRRGNRPDARGRSRRGPVALPDRRPLLLVARPGAGHAHQRRQAPRRPAGKARQPARPGVAHGGEHRAQQQDRHRRGAPPAPRRPRDESW